jgi:ABC-2 type transport system ATP-binding protein
MTASKGLFELKVEINQTEFLTLLEKHPSISKVHLDHETYITTLGEEMSAAEMNRYLFENGFIVSHLVKRKPSLEQQFLDLTRNN